MDRAAGTLLNRGNADVGHTELECYVLHAFSRRTSSAVFDIGPLIRGSFFGQSNRKDAARVREVFSSWVRFVDNAQGQHFRLSLRP